MQSMQLHESCSIQLCTRLLNAMNYACTCIVHERPWSLTFEHAGCRMSAIFMSVISS